MHKQEKKTAEEVAKDLEDINFEEIDESDLRDVFGGDLTDRAESNCNCNVNCSC